MTKTIDPLNELWYHGTNIYFNEWQIPPPPKPGEHLAVPHTAMFFTAHLDYAEGAGSGLCTARLRASARVLDATKPSVESEALRCEVLKNKLASFSVFVNSSTRWTEGWITGDTLRFAFDDPEAMTYIGSNALELVKNGISREDAINLVQHNLTRGLIELICTSARKLKFDAIYGHEVDRHSGLGKMARPWLAVLKKDALTQMQWLRKPCNMC